MSDPLAALRAVSGNDPSSGATTLPNIPAVPYTDDASLTNILSAMKLWMDKAAGSGLTGFASKQDLIDAGVLTKDPSGNIKPTADTSMAIPPVPTGLTASGAMTIILLEWDDPRLAYSNHGYTEVWAAEVDNFSSAQLVGQSSGVIFVHAVGEGSQRYYWIRFVSTAGVMGPYNAVGGTLGQTAQNPAYLLDAMSGILDEQPFFTVETPTEINGVTIPVGTYMKSAFIHDAFITSAMIYELSADKITTGTLAAGRIATNSITADKINGTNLAVVNGTFSGSLQAATGTFNGSINAASGYFGGIVDAASVMSALANSTNYSFSTPGNYVQPIPTGLTADTVRVRIIGGSGGGGGGGGSQKIMTGYSLIAAMGGAGGKGGGGAIIDYTLPYSTLAGSTVTVTVGRGGAGGAGAVEGTFSAGSGQSGTSSSVSSVGSAVGGGGGGGGGEGYFTTGSADESVPVQGANGSTAGNGNGGLGGSAVEPSYIGYKGGTSGQAGTGGYVIISIYKGDVLVKNTSYQALISWLDSRGIGTVPAEAR